MFASRHDLLLATVLLIYASGIALAIGYFFFSPMTERIRDLDFAARSIAAGRLETRLQVTGRDEMSGLARSFNEMAAQLQVVAQKQQEVETLRKDLIAWVSHDLQTPLASIRAIVEALADGVVEDADTRQRYLHTAQRDIGALSVLIDDLFQMAQLDAGGLVLDLAYDSLTDLVSDTLESHSELAARQGISLRGRVDPACDPVWMDSPRIGRVLNNLLGNALRHTPSGGIVEIQAAPTSQGVKVEISDTGEGISLEDIPFVFDRFFRSDRSRNRSLGGAGLGLAISRGIVQAHGGQITVESTPGQLTRFTFTLPRKR
jgi:signal transduction histidine kinase